MLPCWTVPTKRQPFRSTVLIKCFCAPLSFSAARAELMHVVRHDATTPDGCDEAFLADDPISVLDQMHDQIEHFGLGRDGRARSTQFAPVGVQNKAREVVAHRLLQRLRVQDNTARIEQEKPTLTVRGCIPEPALKQATVKQSIIRATRTASFTSSQHWDDPNVWRRQCYAS